MSSIRTNYVPEKRIRAHAQSVLAAGQKHHMLDVLCLLKVIYLRFPIDLTVSRRIPSSTVKNSCFLPLRVKNADLYLTVVNL